MYKGHVLITGVSSGVGKSLVERFITEGYHVFGTIRNKADADHLQATMGSSFSPIVLDVTHAPSINKAFKLVKNATDPVGLKLLINNAGIAISGPITTISVDEYRYQFEVNLFGLISVTQAFLPLLGATRKPVTKKGMIFNISSVSGQIAYPLLGPYCASKFALEGFSHTLRRELMLYEIPVVTIALGPIKTPIWSKSTNLPEEVLTSDFGPIAQRLRGIVLIKAEMAMPPEVCAQRIYQIFRKKRPAVRYTITKNKLINWIIPRYLISHRQLDFLIKKMLKY